MYMVDLAAEGLSVMLIMFGCISYTLDLGTPIIIIYSWLWVQGARSYLYLQAGCVWNTWLSAYIATQRWRIKHTIPGTGCKCAIVVARLPHDINFLLWSWCQQLEQQLAQKHHTNDTITLTHHKIENLPPSAALWGHLPTKIISISEIWPEGHIR